MQTVHTCVIKRLPHEQGKPAPQHIAAVLKKTWGPVVDLSVRFVDTTNAPLKARILSHMNAWSQFGNIKFRETTGTGDVRITLAGDGYWSYLGTDIRGVPSNEPTMSLQDFSMSTPESEYHRVVRHETGHTLACPHEHARPEIVNLLDPAKTIAEFAKLYGWDAQTVQEQVLTPLDPSTLTAMPADVTSIMAYQFSGNCTKSGQPIPGGLDIDAEDGALMAKLYPLAVAPPPPPPTSGSTIVQLGTGTMTLTKDHASISLNVTGTKSQDTPAQFIVGQDLAPMKERFFFIPPALAPIVARFGLGVLTFAIKELAAGKSVKQIINDIEVAVFGFDPTPDK